MDLDKSGLLDQTEILAAFKLMNVNLQTEDLIAVTKAVDENNDGQFSVEEFTHMIYIS